jgi:hypothetical protein
MSLKNLQEISSLVTDYTKKGRFLKVSDGKADSTKYLKLINGLAQKRWASDEEASRDLYGKELGDKTFEMLKSRAKDQLVNMIFQLDTEKRFKSSYDKAYFSVCKNLLSGAILFAQGRINSGEDQLKLALKGCQQYYFNDLLIIAARLLRNVSVFSGSTRKFNFYNDLLSKAIATLQAETLAEQLNQELILLVVGSVGDDENWKRKTNAYFEELKELVNKFDTHTTRINMYRVGLRYYDSINDYRNSIRLATECEQYLYDHPHLIQKVRLGEMSLNKLYAALHLRDYENGSKYADECMNFFNAGTINWLIFLEYYFLLALHTGNNLKAKEIYGQVVNHKSFASYPPQNKEKWRIFEAFLVYADPEQNQKGKRFNVARFINEVPIFSKDKAGYNFSIIVAQVLLSLKIGDYSGIVNKAEALKLYTARYIRKEKNPRSYYFMKMIQVMIRYDFDPVKTEQIAQKFFVKLQESHLGEQSELETLEVIPYDLLWPQVVEMLVRNKTVDIGQ